MNALLPRTRAASALAIFAIAFAAIAGAWIYQGLGYAPCDLCYAQRYAYYFGIPAAAAVAGLARSASARNLATMGLAALALAFAANTVLAVYHSGVEAHLWQGPTACTGALSGPDSAADLLKQLESVKVVRCDAVSLRVFGLTLANWNIFISAALAALAARAIAQAR